MENRFRYLAEVIREGSIRAAADKLRIVPSAVSRQIALIEDELGVPVLERHPRGVRATEIGQLIVRYSRDQKLALDLLLAKIRDFQDLKVAHVTFAVGEGFINDFTSHPFHQFLNLNPRFSFEVMIGSTSSMADKVLADDVDFAVVVNAPQHPELQVRAQSPSPIRVIAHRDHDIVEAKPRTLEDIQNYRLGLLNYDHGVTQIIRRAELRDDSFLNPTLVTPSIELLRLFVSRGEGVILLPEFAVRRDLESGDLVALPLEQADLDHANAEIIVRKGRTLQPASEILITHLIDEMRAFEVVRLRNTSRSS